MLTWMAAFRPQKLDLSVKNDVESKFEIENTKSSRLDPKM